MEKKTVLENLDLVLLVMDETVDGGYASFALLSLPTSSQCLQCYYLSFNTPATAGVDVKRCMLSYYYSLLAPSGDSKCSGER